MKKFMLVNRGRFAATLAVLTTALLLTACGGGDGGSPTPTPPQVKCDAPNVVVNNVCVPPAPAPVANISVTPTACTIASGESKTTVNVTYATANATTVKLVNSAGTTLSTAQSAGVNVDAFIGVNDYQVTASGSGGTVVQSAKATCTCAAGSVANGNTCAAVDRTGPVLTPRTPTFEVIANTISAHVIIDASEVLGATANGIPLGTMAVRDSTSATTTITVGFTDVAHKAVQLVASGLAYAKAYTATFTLPDIAGNTSTFVVPFTTPPATPTVLHYTDKVYATWTDRYPFVVTRTGAVRVKNMTQYNGLGKDLFSCLISSYALADGKIPLLCKDLANLKYRKVYIDPTKDELYEYTGTLPADLAYTLSADGGSLVSFNTKWGDVEPFPNVLHPTWGAFAKVADGWYFTPIENNSVIKFQDASGNISTVKQGEFAVDGNTYIMFSYSN